MAKVHSHSSTMLSKFLMLFPPPSQNMSFLSQLFDYWCWRDRVFVFELTSELSSPLILEGSSFSVCATSPLSCRITQKVEPALLSHIHHLPCIQIMEVCHCHPRFSDMEQQVR